MEQQRNLWWTAAAPSLLLLAVVSVAVASSVTIPNTFTPGTVADANAVNANFVAVRNAVNDNDTRITAIETGASTLDADTLQGLAANRLVRASHAESATTYAQDDTNYTTALSRSVTVPTNGILLMWGNVQATWSSPAAGFTQMWA